MMVSTTSISTPISAAVDPIIEAVEKIKKQLEATVKSIGKVVQEVINLISLKPLKEILALLKKFVPDLIVKLKDAAKEVGSAFLEMVKEISRGKKIGDAFGDFVDKVKEILSSTIKDHISEFIEKIKEKVREIFKPLRDAIASAIEEFKKLIKTGEDFKDAVLAFFDSLKDALLKGVKDFIISVIEKYILGPLGKLFGTVFKVCPEDEKKKKSEASTPGAGGVTQKGVVEEFLDRIVEKFKAVLDDIFGVIDDLITGGVNLIYDLFNSMLNIAGSFFNNLFGQKKESGGGFLDSILKGLEIASSFSGGQASGGPVLGGRSYIVGEQGPELFLPSSGGKIIPNHRLNGSGSGGNVIEVNANVNINGGSADRNGFDEQTAGAIQRQFENMARQAFQLQLRQEMRPGGMLAVGV